MCAAGPGRDTHLTMKPMRGLLRDVSRAGLQVLGGGLATWALLVATAFAALQLPALTTLSTLPAARPVSYDSAGLRFSPLSERFIRAVLGLGPSSPVRTASPLAAGPGTGELGSHRGQPAGGAVAVAREVTHDFTNDNFRDAYLIPTVPFVAHTDMSTATREPGEPTNCSAVGGTAWYSFTSPTRLFVRALVQTAFPAAIAVYTGASVDHLQFVSRSCGQGNARNAVTGVTAAPGTTYYFQVTAVGTGGPITLRVFPPGPADLVSQSSQGAPGNDLSGQQSQTSGKAVSLDGRFVAFQSLATNLDPAHPLGSCNANANPNQYIGQTCPQMYLRDRVSRTTQLISRSVGGQSGNGPSLDPSISADGRYVAFTSSASNLVPGDTNAVSDVFVFDRVTGGLTRESVTSSGAEAVTLPGNAGSVRPRLTRDGRYLAFVSDAINLQPGPACNPATTCFLTLYVKDRLTRSVTLESVTPQGQQATDSNAFPTAWSADNRFLLFEDASAQLVPGAQAGCPVQNNGVQGSGCSQVYRRDVVAGRTKLVSASTSGAPANNSTSPESSDMSGDGRYICFASLADNLVAGDTNGSIDAFRKDLATGEVLRASVDSSGAQVTDTNAQGAATSGFSGGTANPRFSGISDDGRLVVFDSAARELDPFLGHALSAGSYAHDFATGETLDVSTNSTSGVAAGQATAPVIAKGGSLVVFDTAGLDPRDRSEILQEYAHILTEFR